MTTVIDLSNNNGAITLPPADGYIFKASGGDGYTDTLALNFVKQAIAKGKKWGLYHFAVDGYNSHDIDGEVANAVKAYNAIVSAVGKEPACYFLDYEATALTSWSVSDVNNFLDQIKSKINLSNIGVYASESAVNDKEWSGTSRSVPWWVAKYSQTKPSLSDAGLTMCGWQYQQSPQDTSVWYNSWFTGGDDPSPEPQPPAKSSSLWTDSLGDVWHRQLGSVTLLSAVNLRWGAKTSSSKVATLPYGSVVNYDAYSYHDGYVWIRQPRGNGNYAYMATGTWEKGKTTSNWVRW